MAPVRSWPSLTEPELATGISARSFQRCSGYARRIDDAGLPPDRTDRRPCCPCPKSPSPLVRDRQRAPADSCAFPAQTRSVTCGEKLPVPDRRIRSTEIIVIVQSSSRRSSISEWRSVGRLSLWGPAAKLSGRLLASSMTWTRLARSGSLRWSGRLVGAVQVGIRLVALTTCVRFSCQGCGRRAGSRAQGRTARQVRWSSSRRPR